MLTVQKILPNVYRDSVALMQISAKLCELPGVIQAAMISATDGNIERETGTADSNSRIYRGLECKFLPIIAVLRGLNPAGISNVCDDSSGMFAPLLICIKF